jgi:predicted nucleic acid-binding protein
VSPNAASQALEKVRALPITEITEITHETFLDAGRLKAIHRLSLADSIAAAETKVRAATLVTSDHHEFDPIETAENLSVLWIR